MIAALVFWYAGTMFTFVLLGDTNNGWKSVFSAFICWCAWPAILAEHVRDGK